MPGLGSERLFGPLEMSYGGLGCRGSQVHLLLTPILLSSFSSPCFTTWGFSRLFKLSRRKRCVSSNEQDTRETIEHFKSEPLFFPFTEPRTMGGSNSSYTVILESGRTKRQGLSSSAPTPVDEGPRSFPLVH